MWCVAVISFVLLVQRRNLSLRITCNCFALPILGRNESEWKATENYGANNTNFSIAERNCYRQATKSNFIKSNNFWKWSVWAESRIGLHIFTHLHTKFARGSQQSTHTRERQLKKHTILRMHKENVADRERVRSTYTNWNAQLATHTHTGYFIRHFSTFRAKMSVSWVNRWQWMCKGAYFTQWMSLLIVAWLYLFFSLLYVLYRIYDILHSLLSLFASLLSFSIVPFNVSFCWQNFSLMS